MSLDLENYSFVLGRWSAYSDCGKPFTVRSHDKFCLNLAGCLNVSAMQKNWMLFFTYIYCKFPIYVKGIYPYFT